MTGEQKTRIYNSLWLAKYASREAIGKAALIAAVDQVTVAWSTPTWAAA